MRFVAILVAFLSAPCITEQTAQQNRLAHELEVMSLTANAAMLIRNGKTEQAVRLLEQRLTFSVSKTRELTAAGANLPPEFPNLRDAPRRAAEYARATHQPDLAVQAEEILKQLGASPEK